jgi:hypothetical protein
MSEHPVITRLRAAGFLVLPSFDSNGLDSGLLFVQQRQGHVAVVCAYGDNYALGARLPMSRDWSQPFNPTISRRAEVVSFAEAVDELLRPARTAQPGGAAEVDRASFENGAQ